MDVNKIKIKKKQKRISNIKKRLIKYKERGKTINRLSEKKNLREIK